MSRRAAGDSAPAPGRRSAALLLALPLAVLGSLTAHDLAYRLVAGPAHDHLLEETGHGYLEHAWPVIGALAALLTAGVVVGLLGRRGPTVPARTIGLVPILGFVLQEHLERLAHTGAFPTGTVLEPTFVAGLVLQLPFALLALGLAAAILRLTHTARRLVLAGEPVLRAPLPVVPAAPATPPLPRPAPAACRLAGRGPPVGRSPRTRSRPRARLLRPERIPMKRKLLLAAVSAAALAFPASSLAHVVVTPSVANTCAFTTFTMSVPVESASPTTQVRLTIPKGVTYFSVEPVFGWTFETTKAANGAVTSLVAKGSLAAGFFQRFSFVASTPAKPTTVAWKAVQTSEDGSVVKWTGKPGTDHPASRTKIVKAACEED